jgi:tRNA 2-selenouridine synthase
MAIAFPTFAALQSHGFDTLIDVRSPAEFALDHIPGAINLPALSNAERVTVGTIYKQVSAFDARKIGAVMVARNVAAHVEGPLAGHDGAWRPLVYCWRGGQRSGSFATILQQIGWRADTVQGGYRTYRRLVSAALYDTPLPHRLILLDGYTGTAKTDILARLAHRGVQVIDLEGLARHRGSLLGGMPGGQPSQKWFESHLAAALATLDPAKPVVVEAESSKIGERVIPPSVWQAMCAAPRLVIDAPLAARADWLLTGYADMIADPALLKQRLLPLRQHRPGPMVDGWLALIDAGDFRGLTMALMADHYDLAYAKSRRQTDRDQAGLVRVDRLDDAGRDQAADGLARLIEAL